MNKYYIELENKTIVRTSDSWLEKRRNAGGIRVPRSPGENCKLNRWVSLKMG